MREPEAINVRLTTLGPGEIAGAIGLIAADRRVHIEAEVRQAVEDRLAFVDLDATDRVHPVADEHIRAVIDRVMRERDEKIRHTVVEGITLEGEAVLMRVGGDDHEIRKELPIADTAEILAPISRVHFVAQITGPWSDLVVLPEELQPIGETEFVIAQVHRAHRTGTEVAAGIVGFADLTRGAAVAIAGLERGRPRPRVPQRPIPHVSTQGRMEQASSGA